MTANAPRDLPHRRGFERATKVVAEFGPARAGEFARATHILLDGLRTEAAWSEGRLNRNGGPVEFSCATFSDELRYAVETGGPETPPGARLARAGELLEAAGCRAEYREAIDQLGEWQNGRTLCWGAWLGVRHGATGTVFKIYAEAPLEAGPAATALLAPYLGSAPAVTVSGAQLAMVARTPGSERREFYFELPERGLRGRDLDGLLTSVGLAERRAALLDLVRGFDFRGGQGPLDILPDAQWGFSYSVLPGGRAPVFSLFVQVQDLVGGDGFLRRQILAATYGRGWKPGCYATLSEPLDRWYFRSAYHNMISFVVASAPMAGFQISLSPPPAEPGN